jgi:hypothetical protein
VRESLEWQAREAQQKALARAATEGATAMASDAEQAHLRLRMECNELMGRTSQLTASEQKHEAEAWQLRSELASAETGLNGLTMEIGELTMELAKLRAQAATDAHSQKTSSEARIELLELRRQLLGRETMLGHEREVSDKRIDAARRDVCLLNERLDLAVRERDWAMQELHASRSDERLALTRSRNLAEEGTGLRARCDALEAARRAMQWEIEVLRSGSPRSGDNGKLSERLSPSASSPDLGAPTSHSLSSRTLAGSGGVGSRLLRNLTPPSVAPVPESWAHPGAAGSRETVRQNSTPIYDPAQPVRGAFGLPLQHHIPVTTHQPVSPLGLVSSARAGSRTPRANSPAGIHVNGATPSFSSSAVNFQPIDSARSLLRHQVGQRSAGTLHSMNGGAISPPAGRIPLRHTRDISPRGDGRWS